MGVKIADLIRKDAEDEKWFTWMPEGQTSPRLEFKLRVCPPRRFVATINRHTKSVYSRRARGHIEQTDNESAATEVIRMAVVDWKNITVGTIRELTLTKPTDVPDNTVIAFDAEGLTELVDAVPELGAWIIETSSNVRNFNRPSAEEQVKNS